nr:MAG TPA: hypothetical protein [Bacteriophage sp.]
MTHRLLIVNCMALCFSSFSCSFSDSNHGFYLV